MLFPFSYLNLKLAAECNLRCTYCYWFRDPTVLDKPKILDPDIERILLERLTQHIQHFALKSFTILFHGGEPLLFGKRRFANFCNRLRRDIEAKLGVDLSLLITTNGALLDDEWVILFKAFGVHPTVSIDGPKAYHDQARLYKNKKGSFEEVVRGIRLLQKHAIEPGILSVCNPEHDPIRTANFLVDELGMRGFDILVPDHTHDEQVRSIAPFYKDLFDHWYENLMPRGIEIRLFTNMMKGLLGREGCSESIGYGPIQTLIMLTDGTLEPLDVLRIASPGSTKTQINIRTHSFQDVQSDPVWLEARQASLSLPTACRSCVYRSACGGGFLPSRFSQAKRFDNPSVYCSDLYELFTHIAARIASDIEIQEAASSMRFHEWFQLHGTEFEAMVRGQIATPVPAPRGSAIRTLA